MQAGHHIDSTARVYPGVVLAGKARIEEYSIIGAAPRGHREGELETIIEDGALIRSHSVIYAGNRIGKNFQAGNKVNIREMNEIGDDVSIGTSSVIEHHVRIGNGVRIHSQVFVPEYSEIADGAWLGPNVVLTNAKYPRSPGVKESLMGPVIGRNAKIGANATILPGITIGENALIGAGSVVVRDVPASKVVVGNPAKVIKEVADLPY